MAGITNIQFTFETQWASHDKIACGQFDSTKRLIHLSGAFQYNTAGIGNESVPAKIFVLLNG